MDAYADGSGPVDDNDNTQDAASGPTIYNPRLVQLRADHLNQLQDPNLRSFATRAMLAEGGSKGLASNFEQLSNYANARGISLKDALQSGFYGPVNNGTIASSLSPAQAAAGDAAIQSVFSQGRNKIGYRIDQGMIGDPNYNKEQNSEYRPASIDGSFFADHPAVGIGWAQKQLALDKAAGINPDNQFEATGSPVAAINAAAGVKTPSGKGALAFSGDKSGGDDDSSDDTGALKPGQGALFDDDKPNKMHSFGAMLANVGAALAGISNPAAGANLRAIAKGITDTASTNYQYMMGPNGQLIRINKDTGAADFRSIPGAQAGKYVPLYGIDPVSGQRIATGAMDSRTGQPIRWGQGQQGNGQQADPNNPYNLPDNIEDLKQRGPAGISFYNQLQAMHSGAMPYPPMGGRGGNAANNKMLRDGLAFYYPNLQQSDYDQRTNLFNNLNNKGGSQFGAQLTQLGHSGDAMRQLAQDAEGLGNSSYRALNSIPAAIGNNTPLAQQYAGKSSAFNQKADALIGELSKLYNGTQGGGVAEREIMRQNTPRADDPPEIIASKLQALRDLYESRRSEMEQQIRAPFVREQDGGDSVVKQYMPQSAAANLDNTAASIARLHSGTAKPAASSAPAKQQYQEGMTATGKNGARVIYQNGNWVPLKQ